MTKLPAARRKNILDYLENDLLLSIQEMAKVLGVPPMTIHRDLDKLASEGLIQKVHGGAILAQSPESQSATSQKRFCQMCHQQTDARMAFFLYCEGSPSQYTCCPHCGLMLSCQNETFTASFATDYLYGYVINANKAIYLLHSRVTLCCSPSVLSFANREDATSFQCGFGGTLMNLNEILFYLHQSHSRI